MDPKEIIKRFFTYQSLSYDEYDEAELDPLAAWLSHNSNAWREPRNVAKPAEMTQGTLLLIGEEGSGKTTALQELTEELEGDLTNLVLRLDFSHAATLFMLDRGEFAKALDRILLTQIESLTFSKDIYPTYIAATARRLLAVGTGEAITEARTRWNRTQIAAMSDDELLNEKIVQRILRIHRSSGIDQGLLAVQALQHVPGRRAIIIVDNVDHLNRHDIPRVLGLLSTIVDGPTHAYIALRPENEVFYPNFRQLRLTERVALESDGFMYKIAERRLRGAEGWVRTNLPQKTAEMRNRLDVLRKNISSVRGDQQTANLIERWQNGNLRQMMAFLLEFEGPLLGPGERPGPMRGAVYDRLIRFSTPRYLHEIFEARAITDTRFELPFVFLHLRVLALLSTQKGTEVPISFVYDTFSLRFDISEDKVRTAMRDLQGRLGNSGAPLRLIGGDATGAKEASAVVLLPAGRVFIEQIVFSVDFLSWIYDNSTTPLTLVDPRGKRQTKFDKALVVLRERILRAFILEHPYMNDNRGIKPIERERLRGYVEAFNYGPGRWFLSRMLSDLDQYSDERKLDRTLFNEVAQNIRRKLRRLDGCFRNEY